MIAIWGIVGYKEYELANGREIVLKTVPVDPRDIFRGEYVILRYEISDIDTYDYGYYYSNYEGDNSDYGKGDTVYVTLSEPFSGQGPLKYNTVSKIKPSGYAQPFIKGTVTEVVKDEEYGRVLLEVEYGIESYFVEEGTGKAIEQQARRGDLRVKVVLDKDGNATIKSLE